MGFVSILSDFTALNLANKCLIVVGFVMSSKRRGLRMNDEIFYKIVDVLVVIGFIDAIILLNYILLKILMGGLYYD